MLYFSLIVFAAALVLAGLDLSGVEVGGGPLVNILLMVGAGLGVVSLVVKLASATTHHVLAHRHH